MVQFKGVFTALVTPFLANGELDLEGFKKNLAFQAERSADGVVILGTTGESSTVNYHERKQLIEIAVNELKGTLPVVIGTGSNSTATTIAMTAEAKKLGADAAIIITPYYNKPTQNGLYEHYKAITQEVDLPVIVYNCPGRTSVNLLPATFVKLSHLKNIDCIKEASGNILQISEILEQLPDVSLLSGDDGLTLPSVCLGAKGVVSVLSNLDPKPIKEMLNAFESGDFVLARQLHHKMLPLIRALFVETNPIPVKAAMNLLGQPAGPCRLPLTEASPSCIENLKNLLDIFLIRS